MQSVIIVGSGLTGLLLSHVLAEQNIKVTLIESKKINKKISCDQNDDGRGIALTFKSYKFLKENNLWSDIEKFSNKIEQIRVADQKSTMHLHFSNQIIEDKLPFGYMVEAQNLLNVLTRKVLSHNNITLFDQESVISIIQNEHHVKVNTEDNIYVGNALFACDGKNSTIRDLLQIKSYKKLYNQTAIVANIKHEINHQNIALELFLKNGPLAILPLKTGNLSTLVWCHPQNIAKTYSNMSNKELEEFLANAMQKYLGKIEINSKVYSYPLSYCYVNKYYLNKSCLVADAAHAIHPIAGQGFNQGILDIKCLSELISKNLNQGLNISDNNLFFQYQQNRRTDNFSMLLFTDIIDKVFSNNNMMLKILRRPALALINKQDFIKKFLIEYAMGLRR